MPRPYTSAVLPTDAAMPFDPKRHHRRSIRLPRHDYTSAGAYFVTLVTVDRDCLFDDPRHRAIAERCWLALPRHFLHTALDAWIVMPNHLHGIVVLQDPPEAAHRGPTLDRTRPRPGLQPGSLGTVVGTFKSVTARRINRLRRTPSFPVWQRNYYERIVRDERELQHIRAYITANPTRWNLDRENPDRIEARDAWSPDEDQWFA